MNYSKVTNNDEVVRLLKQRAKIEKQIQKLDNKALINYELEKITDSEMNDIDTSEEKYHMETAIKCPFCGNVQEYKDGTIICSICGNMFLL